MNALTLLLVAGIAASSGAEPEKPGLSAASGELDAARRSAFASYLSGDFSAAAKDYRYLVTLNPADAQVRERLRSLDWKAAFVFDHLAEAYTASLIDEKTPRPALMLQTTEGRVLFQSSWKTGVMPELTAALDRAFGHEPAPAAHTAAIE